MRAKLGFIGALAALLVFSTGCSFFAAVPPVPIILSQQSITVEAGGAVQVLASAGANGAQVLDRAVTGQNGGLGAVQWQIEDKTIATINFTDTLCAVTGVSPGTTKLRAKTANGTYADCLVTVTPALKPTNGLRISQSIVPMQVKQQVTVNLQTMDFSTPIKWTEEGNSIDKPIFRLVGNDTTALIVGLNPGQAVVRASQGENTTTTTVFVSEGSGSDSNSAYMTSPYPTLTMLEGIETPVAVTLVGVPSNQTQGMTWTESKKYSSTPILRILANGTSALITGLQAGVTAIDVTHPGIALPYTILISVNAKTATQVMSLSTSAAVTQVGGQVPVLATITNSSPTDYYNIVWKIEDTSVAKLLGSGQNVTIMGQSVGQTKLTATYIGLPVRSVDVLVQNAAGATSYTAVRNAITMVKGRSEAVNAQVVGSVAGSVIQALTWQSLDPTIVTVFGAGTSGSIKAVDLGIGKIRISHPQYPELTAIIQVQVVSEDSELVSKALTLSQSAGIISIGQQLSLSAIVEGGVSSDYQAVSWSIEQGTTSSGTPPIRLLGTGQTVTLLGQAPGEARITATLGTHKSVCDVVVQSGVGGGSYIQTTNAVSLTIGQSQNLVASIVGGLPGAASSSMTWTSDNPDIATIFGSGTGGTVRGISVGKATITIKQPTYNLEAQVLVQVLSVAATPKPVSLVQTAAVLIPGQQLSLQATIDNGSTTEYQALTWKVTNTSTTSPAIRLLGGGQSVTLLGLSPGDAEVEVSFGTFSAKCQVVVQEGAAAGQSYIQTTNSVSLGVDQSQTVNATIVGNLPGGAQSKLVWTSDNTSIATVFGAGTSGVIKGVADGTTKIVLTHPDYPSLTATIQVQVLSGVITRPVKISQGSAIIVPNQQLLLTATIDGAASGDYEKLTWDVQVKEGTAPVRLLGSGQSVTVLGLNGGQVRVVARLGTASAGCDILVQVTSSGTSYIQTTNAVSMTEGGVRSLTAQVMGALGGSATSDLTWSSEDSAVATVFGSGGNATITGVSTGETQIKVKHAGAGLVAVIMVQVLPTGSVTVSKPVTLSQSAAVLVANQQLSLTATIDNAETSDYNALVWSVTQVGSTTALRVLGSGKTVTVLGLAEGEAKVKATLGSYSAECQVVIQNGVAGDTYIQTTNTVSLVEAEVQNITASIVGAVPGSALAGLVWTSTDESIVTVFGSGGSGILTAVKSGSTTIKITHPSYSALKATIQVQVKSAVEITKPIKLSQSSGVMVVNQQMGIAAEITGGTQFDYGAIQWSVTTVSGTNPLRLLGNGQTVTLLGLASGEARVTAKLGTATSSCDVVVQASGGEQAYIQTTNAVSLVEAQVQTISATIVGSIPGSALAGLVWTSADETVVSVFGSGSSGVLTAIKSGSTTVQITHPTYPDLKASIMVQVKSPVEITKPIKLSQSSGVMVVSQQLILSAEITGGTQFDYGAIQWSATTVSGTKPLRLLGSGQTVTLLGLSSGEARVTAKLGTATSSCDVVIQATVDSQAYVQTTNAVTLEDGGVRSLNAQIMGMSASATAELTWTSANTAVATVFGSGGSGTITGVAVGETQVTVKHPGSGIQALIAVQVLATGSVTISKPVSLSQSSTVMVPNQQLLLAATIDNGETTDYNSIVWTATTATGSPAARILGSGKTVTVLGLVAGETTIKATLGSFNATCQVLVQAGVAGASYIKTNNSVSLTTGDLRTVTAEVIGGSATATSELVWSTANTAVATVFGGGDSATITGVATGQTQITVKHPTTGLQSVIMVQVLNAGSVTISKPVSLSQGSAVMLPDQQLSLTATVENGDTVDYGAIVWTVTKITGTTPVRLLGSGKSVTVLGLSEGEASVKATLGSYSATCQVLVQAGVTGSNYIEVKNAVSLAASQEETLLAKLIGTLPNGTESGLVWTSSDSTIASVFGGGTSGTIKGIAIGTTTVKVWHPSYPSLTATIQVQILAAGQVSKPVTLNQSSGIVVLNQQMSLSATIDNGNTVDYNALVWTVTTVSGANPVRILGSGRSVTVLGMAQGEAKVTATLGTYSATCQILVQGTSSGSLYIETTNSLTLTAGQVQSVLASLVGVVDGAADAELTWASDNPSVAAVFGLGTRGTVTAAGAGTAKITVTSPTYNVKAYIMVQVVASEQVSKPVTLSQSSAILVKDQQFSLSASIDGGSPLDYGAIVWSLEVVSGTAPVRILGTGQSVTILGLALGEAKVKATLGSFSSTCQVLVQAGVAGASYIKTISSLSLTKGDLRTVTAEVIGGSATATSELTWTSANASVATVFGAGDGASITGVATGQTQITVKHPSTGLQSVIIVQVLDAGSVTISKPVSLSQSSAVMVPDQQQSLTVTVENGESVDYGAVVWTVTKITGTTPVRLLGSGKTVTVLGLSEGEASVKATLGSYSATCQVLIQAGASGSAYIDVKNAVSLAATQQETLVARVMGSLPAGTETGLVWTTTNSAIATVFGGGTSGTIKGVAIGTTTVKVTHPSYPSLSATIQVQILAAGQVSKPVTLSQSSAIIVKDQQLSLSATIDGGTTIDYGSIVWSIEVVSGTAPVRTLGTGQTVTVLGLALGEAKVKATLGTFSATCQVLVQAGVAGASYVKTNNAVSLTTGDLQTVTAEVIGGSATATSELVWTSANAAVATVFGGGASATITGVGTGQTQVIVKHLATGIQSVIMVQVLATGSVTISKPVTLSQSSAVMLPDQQLSLTATIENGATVDYGAIVWSVTKISGTTPVRLLGSGRTVTILGLSEGEASVKATLGSFSSTCQVLVQAGVAGSTYIEVKNAVSLAVTQEEALVAKVVGALPNGTESGLVWTSTNSAVASVFGGGTNGTIKGNAIGNTTVKVSHPSYPSLTATIQVQILAAGQVSKPVTLNQSSGIVVLNQQMSLSATIDNGSTVDYNALVWSVTNVSGVNPVRVLGSGRSVTVLGMAQGEAKVTATLGTYSATCQILVQGTSSGSLYIETTNSLTLTAGQVQNVMASLMGVVDGAADAELTWVSDKPTVAAVFGLGTRGTVTAAGAGTAKITVTSPTYNVKAYIMVQVVAAEQVSKPVTMSQSSAILVKDQQFTLSATIDGGSALDYGAIVWSLEVVSGTTPVRILGSGQSVTILGLALGEAKVKATLGSFNATCQVLVQATSSGTSYIQVPSVLTLTKGVTQDVTAMIVGDIPSSATQGLTWTSSASTIVSVFGGGDTGKLTAVAPGIATITVTQAAYSLAATIKVQVVDPVTVSKPVSLSTTSAVMILNQQVSLTAEVTGGTAADYSGIVWSLTNVVGNNPVRVLGTGQTVTLLGMATGEATVKATLGGYSATCQVLIQAGSAGSTYIQTQNSMTITVGDNAPATATIIGNVPASATSGLLWTSLNPTIATVFGAGSSGSISGVAPGIATISVTHPDYSGLSAQIKVQVLAAGSVVVSKPVSLSQTSAIIIPNQQMTLSAVVANATPTDYSSIIWTVDGGTNASTALRILGTGQSITVLGLANGTSKVQAKLGTYTATCEILVQSGGTGGGVGGAMYITSQQSTTSVNVGTPVMMTAQLVGGSPVEQQGLVWTSSDPTVATVFGAGASAQVTGKATGVCVISVTHTLASTPYKIYVQVQSPTQVLTLNDTALSLQVGTQSTMVATLTNASDADYNRLTWSVTGVTPGQASPVLVLGSGRSVLVMATSAGGPVKVKATTPSGQVATCDIIVTDPNVVTGGSLILTTNRYAYQLTTGVVQEMSVTLQNGTAAQAAQTVWSVDNKSVASVLGSGTTVLLNTLAAGQATITVSNPSVGSTLKLYLSVSGDGQAVTLSQTALSMIVGDQTSLTATIQGATALQNASIVWASNNTNVLQIVQGGTSGLLVATGAGQAKITVTAPGCVPAVANVLILPSDPTVQKYIAINPSVDTLTVGESKTYSAQIVGGTTADLQSLIWNIQSGTNVTVLGQGGSAIIAGVTPGVSVINIRSTKYPELQASMSISIKEVTYGLTMSMGALTMSPSQQLTISAVGQNLSAEMIAGAKWSTTSNAPGITITPSGLNAILTTNAATGIAQVSVSVTAGAKTLTASLLVNVQAPVIPEVSKYFTTVNNLVQVNVNEQQSLSVTYNNALPADLTHIKWSILPDAANTNVVQLTAVSTSAYVKGLKAGTATLVVSDDRGGVNELTMLVTVSPTNLSLTLSPSTATIKVGDSINIITSIPGASAADYSKVVYKKAYIDNGVIRTSSGIVTDNTAIDITGVSNNTVTVTAREISANCYLIAYLPGMSLENSAVTKINVESSYYVDIVDTVFNSNLYKSPSKTVAINSYPESVQLSVASISDTKVVTAAIQDDGKGNRALTMTAIGPGSSTITVQSATGSKDTISVIVAVDTALSWTGTPSQIGSSPGKEVAPGDDIILEYHIGPKAAGLKAFSSEILTAFTVGIPEMVPGSDALYNDGSADFKLKIRPNKEGNWTIPIQNAMNAMTLNFEVRSTMGLSSIRSAIMSGTVVKAVGTGSALTNSIVGSDAGNLFAGALSPADYQDLVTFVSDTSGTNDYEPLAAKNKLRVMRNTPTQIETKLAGEITTILKNPTVTVSYVSLVTGRTLSNASAGSGSVFIDYTTPFNDTATEEGLGYYLVSVKHGYNGAVEDQLAINVYGISMAFGLDPTSTLPPSSIVPSGSATYTLKLWPKTLSGVTFKTLGNLTVTSDNGVVSGDQIQYTVQIQAGATSASNSVSTTVPANVPSALGLTIPVANIKVGYDAPFFIKKVGFPDQTSVQLTEGVMTVIETSGVSPGTTGQMFTFGLTSPAVVVVTGATAWTPVTGSGVLTSPTVSSFATDSVTLNFQMNEGYYDATAAIEYPAAPGVRYPIKLRVPVYITDSALKTSLTFITNNTGSSGIISTIDRLASSADYQFHSGDGYDVFKSIIGHSSRPGNVGASINGSEFEIPNIKSWLTESSLAQTYRAVDAVNAMMSVVGYHYLKLDSGDPTKLIAVPDKRKLTDTGVAGPAIAPTLLSFYGTSDVDLYGEWTSNPKSGGADYYVYEYMGQKQRYMIKLPVEIQDNIESVTIERSKITESHPSTSAELLGAPKPGLADMHKVQTYLWDSPAQFAQYEGGVNGSYAYGTYVYDRPQRGLVQGSNKVATMVGHILTGGSGSKDWTKLPNDLVATTAPASAKKTLGSGNYGAGDEALGFMLDFPQDLYTPAFTDSSTVSTAAQNLAYTWVGKVSGSSSKDTVSGSVTSTFGYSGNVGLEWQQGVVPTWIDSISYDANRGTTIGYGGFIYITINRKVGPDVRLLVRVIRRGVAVWGPNVGLPVEKAVNGSQNLYVNQRDDPSWTLNNPARIIPDGNSFIPISVYVINGSNYPGQSSQTSLTYRGNTSTTSFGWDSWTKLDISSGDFARYAKNGTFRVYTPGNVYQN